MKSVRSNRTSQSFIQQKDQITPQKTKKKNLFYPRKDINVCQEYHTKSKNKENIFINLIYHIFSAVC